MKRMLLAATAIVSLAAYPVYAQLTGYVGQTAGGAINQTTFDANSDSVGFNTMSITPGLVVPATATTQALATVIVTKATVITTCSGTTGVKLPAIQRYEPITIMNRSGGSCLIWPSSGATVETALGTDSATNASFTMLTNTDVTFRPITATRWLQ